MERKDICESFNSIVWHDSKLRGVCVRHRDDIDDVIVHVELREYSTRELEPANVILTDAVFFICDLDLQGKRECSDDISHAGCSVESEMKENIQKTRLEFSPDALKDDFHFHFQMIPPGGSVDVIAANFEIVKIQR